MTGAIQNLLPPGLKKQLTAIKQTARQADAASLKLATGRNVNRAVDNPQNFFTSQSLKFRSNDLSRTIDGIGQSLRTIEVAESGLRSIENLLNQAEAYLLEAELALFSTDEYSITELTPASAADIVEYNAGQDIGGTINVDTDENEISFSGNLWRQIEVNYEITEDTFLEFDFRSSFEPEISAIGFDNNTTWLDQATHFFLNGSQLGGVPYLQPTATYDFGGVGPYQSYSIPVGQFLQGQYDNLTFIHDDDSAPFGDAFYRNLRLREEGAVRADTPLLLEYEAGYQEILDQITRLTIDTDYRGINLLNGDMLVTSFNENRTSTLKSEGIDAGALGLGLGTAELRKRVELQGEIARIRSAREEVRQYATTLTNQFGVIETRSDFTRSTINILDSGGDDLTVANQNELGAQLLATQVRQSVQFETLSFAAQLNLRAANLLFA